MIKKNGLIITILAIAAILLQIIVSPLLNIGGTSINFCLACLVATSVTLNDSPKVALSLVLGILMDLTQGGPFGAFALLFLISNLLAFGLTTNLNAGGFKERALLGFLVCALANVLHCLIVGLATPGLTVAIAFTSGQLWSCLFDGLVSIVFLIATASFCKDEKIDAWASRY